ncbi:MAG: class I SAM-dependent methyltransferase [bacterium]|nr:class I SAM-dependent methyltransferase [bacterium]
MNKEWYYNEYLQTGTDFSDIKKVEAYDTKMTKFRNYQREAEWILDTLGVASGQVLLDIGTGTGHFALAAAKKCQKVYAVDISKTMLEYAKLKAKKENISNIEWQHSGFLNFDFPGIKFDHVVSSAALHHLPDHWKQVAINNIYKALKDQGNFYLGDVIFSSGNIDEIDAKIEAWLDNMKNIDAELSQEAVLHVKKEYSTFAWIIEGMFGQVGFKYQKLVDASNFMSYLCTKSPK